MDYDPAQPTDDDLTSIPLPPVSGPPPVPPPSATAHNQSTASSRKSKADKSHRRQKNSNRENYTNPLDELLPLRSKVERPKPRSFLDKSHRYIDRRSSPATKTKFPVKPDVKIDTETHQNKIVPSASKIQFAIKNIGKIVKSSKVQSKVVTPANAKIDDDDEEDINTSHGSSTLNTSREIKKSETDHDKKSANFLAQKPTSEKRTNLAKIAEAELRAREVAEECRTAAAMVKAGQAAQKIAKIVATGYVDEEGFGKYSRLSDDSRKTNERVVANNRGEKNDKRPVKGKTTKKDDIDRASVERSKNRQRIRRSRSPRRFSDDRSQQFDSRKRTKDSRSRSIERRITHADRKKIKRQRKSRSRSSRKHSPDRARWSVSKERSRSRSVKNRYDSRRRRSRSTDIQKSPKYYHTRKGRMSVKKQRYSSSENEETRRANERSSSKEDFTSHVIHRDDSRKSLRKSEENTSLDDFYHGKDKRDDDRYDENQSRERDRIDIHLPSNKRKEKQKHEDEEQAERGHQIDNDFHRKTHRSKRHESSERSTYELRETEEESRPNAKYHNEQSTSVDISREVSYDSFYSEEDESETKRKRKHKKKNRKTIKEESGRKKEDKTRRRKLKKERESSVTSSDRETRTITLTKNVSRKSPSQNKLDASKSSLNSDHHSESGSEKETRRITLRKKLPSRKLSRQYSSESVSSTVDRDSSSSEDESDLVRGKSSRPDKKMSSSEEISRGSTRGSSHRRQTSHMQHSKYSPVENKLDVDEKKEPLFSDEKNLYLRKRDLQHEGATFHEKDHTHSETRKRSTSREVSKHIEKRKRSTSREVSKHIEKRESKKSDQPSLEKNDKLSDNSLDVVHDQAMKNFTSNSENTSSTAERINAEVVHSVKAGPSADEVDQMFADYSRSKTEYDDAYYDNSNTREAETGQGENLKNDHVGTFQKDSVEVLTKEEIHEEVDIKKENSKTDVGLDWAFGVPDLDPSAKLYDKSPEMIPIVDPVFDKGDENLSNKLKKITGYIDDDVLSAFRQPRGDSDLIEEPELPKQSKKSQTPDDKRQLEFSTSVSENLNENHFKNGSPKTTTSPASCSPHSMRNRTPPPRRPLQKSRSPSPSQDEYIDVPGVARVSKAEVLKEYENYCRERGRELPPDLLKSRTRDRRNSSSKRKRSRSSSVGDRHARRKRSRSHQRRSRSRSRPRRSNSRKNNRSYRYDSRDRFSRANRSPNYRRSPSPRYRSDFRRRSRSREKYRESSSRDRRQSPSRYNRHSRESPRRYTKSPIEDRYRQRRRTPGREPIRRYSRSPSPIPRKVNYRDSRDSPTPERDSLPNNSFPSSSFPSSRPTQTSVTIVASPSGQAAVAAIAEQQHQSIIISQQGPQQPSFSFQQQPHIMPGATGILTRNTLPPNILVPPHQQSLSFPPPQFQSMNQFVAPPPVSFSSGQPIPSYGGQSLPPQQMHMPSQFNQPPQLIQQPSITPGQLPPVQVPTGQFQRQPQLGQSVLGQPPKIPISSQQPPIMVAVSENASELSSQQPQLIQSRSDTLNSEMSTIGGNPPVLDHQSLLDSSYDIPSHLNSVPGIGLTEDPHKIKLTLKPSQPVENNKQSNEIGRFLDKAPTVSSVNQTSGGTAVGAITISSSNVTSSTETLGSPSSSRSTLDAPGKLKARWMQQTAKSDAELAAKASESTEQKIPYFIPLIENEYHVSRRNVSRGQRKLKRLVCECFLSSSADTTGSDTDGGPSTAVVLNEIGCGSDCINRLMMIECHPKLCPCGAACSNQMFTKRTYCEIEPFQTEWKGFGLRAKKVVDPGTFVMEYIGEVISYNELCCRVERYEKNQHYYLMALENDRFIDATYKGNVSRFINHSCDPNCETQKWTVNGEMRVGFFAIKPIAPGDEFTFDYRFEQYSKELQKCYCGSANCRGTLGGRAKWLKNWNDEDIVDSTTESELSPHSRKLRRRDLLLEEEVNSLCQLDVGLLVTEDVIKLSRLMVRVEKPLHRLAMLTVLEKTEEIGCLKLFIDYHGLHILWSWMIDLSTTNNNDNSIAKSEKGDEKIESSSEVGDNSEANTGDDEELTGGWTKISLTNELKLKILTVLKKLPITNRNVVQDSKILSVVEKWAKTGSSDNVDSSTDSEFVSDFTVKGGESSCTSTPYDTPITGSPVDSLSTTIKSEDSIDSSDEQRSTMPTKRYSLRSRVKKEDKISALNSDSEASVMKSRSLLEIAPATSTTSNVTSSKVENKSSLKEVTTPTEDIAKALEIIRLASELFQLFMSLKEVYRIPRRQKFEERKKREHDLDKRRSLISGPAARIFRTTRRGSTDRTASTPGRRGSAACNENSPLMTLEQKQERRKIFETKVAVNELADKQRAVLEDLKTVLGPISKNDEMEVDEEDTILDPVLPEKNVVVNNAIPQMFPPEIVSNTMGAPSSVMNNVMMPPPPSMSGFSMGTSPVIPPAGFLPTPGIDPSFMSMAFPGIQPMVPGVPMLSSSASAPAMIAALPMHDSSANMSNNTVNVTNANVAKANFPPINNQPTNIPATKPNPAVGAKTGLSLTGVKELDATLSEVNKNLKEIQELKQHLDQQKRELAEQQAAAAQKEQERLEKEEYEREKQKAAVMLAISKQQQLQLQQQSSQDKPENVLSTSLVGQQLHLKTAPKSTQVMAVSQQKERISHEDLIEQSHRLSLEDRLATQFPLIQESAEDSSLEVVTTAVTTPVSAPAIAAVTAASALISVKASSGSRRHRHVHSGGVSKSHTSEVSSHRHHDSRSSSRERSTSVAATKRTSAVNTSVTAVTAVITPTTTVSPPSAPVDDIPKLPHGWKTAKDTDGKIYYYHVETRITQWDPPTIDSDSSPVVSSTRSSKSSHHKRSKDATDSSISTTTKAAADTSSSPEDKKRFFRRQLSDVVVGVLSKYRKPNCKIGRIETPEDFKHLARKLTHTIMAKEEKHVKHVDDLELNDDIRHKAKQFIIKYMSKQGKIYRKAPSPNFFPSAEPSPAVESTG